jgi:hypothetical protein
VEISVPRATSRDFLGTAARDTTRSILSVSSKEKFVRARCARRRERLRRFPCASALLCASASSSSAVRPR